MKSKPLAAVAPTSTVEVAPTTILDAALAAESAGISVFHPTLNGLKKPMGSWKANQSERADPDQIRRWWVDGRNTGLIFICGRVSGGLELLELDGEFRAEFVAAAEAVGLGPLLARVEAGYGESSPGGGHHWLYRCPTPKGNTKLAEEPDPHVKKGRKPLIETRGEGGYVVVAPSWGKVHKSGRPYVLMSGGVDSIAEITDEERDALWDLARTFDRMPEGQAATDDPFKQKQKLTATAEGRADAEVRPGDDFNERTTWAELMPQLGFSHVHTRGETAYWRRDGKSEGWSATTNHNGSDCLYMFTSSSDFPPMKSYTRFGAYTLANHGGDFTAAVKALAAAGYGGPGRPQKARGVLDGLPNTIGLKVAEGTYPDDVAAPLDSTEGGEPDAQLARLHRTDLGNAERFVARHGSGVRYCHPWKTWLNWDGRRWSMDDRGAIRHRAHLTARSILAESSHVSDTSKCKDLVKHAFASEAHGRIGGMLGCAQSMPGITILHDEMDKDLWAFNCGNGTLDLRTAELRPHRRGDHITKLCPVDYDPAAECPLWLATLATFFHREDPAAQGALIGYWQRICGYAICGAIRDHVMPVAYGIGSNGKSTLLNTLLEVMGRDYAMKAAPDMFMSKKSDSHPTDRADLFGKRLVVAIETQEGRGLNETLVKELTGGDKIRARRMREDFWEFTPTHTLIMATNHKPVVKGTDNGIWRRLRLVPFSVTVEGEAADLSMPDKLKAEAAGILAWCVRGCLDWQRIGLDTPDEVSDATADYRAGQDLIGSFLGERTTKIEGAGLKVKAGVLYAAYKEWAVECGETYVSQTQFGDAIKERGIKSKTSNGVWYQDLGLNSKAEPAPPERGAI